jgi:hypothetical protein
MVATSRVREAALAGSGNPFKSGETRDTIGALSLKRELVVWEVAAVTVFDGDCG